MATKIRKLWRWLLLGLSAGLILAAVRLWMGPAFAYEQTDGIVQAQFEWGVFGRANPSRHQLLNLDINLKRSTLLRDVVVHPPLDGRGAYWVTGEICSFDLKAANSSDPKTPMVSVETWNGFLYQARSPYRANAGVPGTYPSVIEYLQILQKDPNLDVSYRYAWWEAPMWTITIPPISGIFLIGFLTPAAIGLVSRIRLGGRTAKEAGGISLWNVSASASEGEKVDQPANIEWAMQVTTTEETPLSPLLAKKPIAVVALPPNPTEAHPQSNEDDQADVEYRGEYYPVAKTNTEHLN